jgi:hypothetical protein
LLLVRRLLFFVHRGHHEPHYVCTAGWCWYPVPCRLQWPSAAAGPGIAAAALQLKASFTWLVRDYLCCFHGLQVVRCVGCNQ